MTPQTTLYHTQRRIREFFQDQWFDRTRRIHTSGDLSLPLADIPDARDSEHFVPAHIREALRTLPLAGCRVPHVPPLRRGFS